MTWAWWDDPNGAGYWLAVNCPACLDVLWLRPQAGTVRVGDPGFGQLERCEACADYTPAQLKARAVRFGFNAAGFMGREAKRLATFDPQRQPGLDGKQAAGAAKRDVLAWAAGSGPDFTVLVGRSGVGKTHLAEGAVSELVHRERNCRYVIWEDFSHHTQDRFEQAHDYLDQLRDTDNLLIDDVGAAYESDRQYLRARLHEILGHRFQWGKRTLVAGNLAPAGDEAQEVFWRRVFGERFASRMTDRTRVKVVSLWACADMRPVLDRERAAS